MSYFREYRKQMPFGNVVILSLLALTSWLLVLMSVVFSMREHTLNLSILALIGIVVAAIIQYFFRYDRHGYWIAFWMNLVSIPIYLLFRSMIFDADAIFILAVIAISAQWGIGPGIFLASLAWIDYGVINMLNPIHPDPVAQITINGGFFLASAVIVGALAQRRQSALIARTKIAENLEKSYVSVLTTMSMALDARDPNTQGHSGRVARLAQAIAQEMNLSTAEVGQVRWGALLHDMGKIGTPDAILHKPGQLTGDEWELMRLHTEIGYEMLKTIPFLDSALDVVLYHHERFDGNGYPTGCKGNDIPLSARITAVADSYDAMTSNRPYRDGRLQSDALNEIHKLSGSQFDPEVVSAFDRALMVLRMPTDVDQEKISSGLNECFIGNSTDEKTSRMTLLEKEMVLYYGCIKGVEAPTN